MFLKIILWSSVSPSLTLYQKFYSLSRKKYINLKDRERKKFLFPYTKKKKTVSPLKEDAVLMFKHDWCVRESVASFLFSIRSHRSQTWWWLEETPWSSCRIVVFQSRQSIDVDHLLPCVWFSILHHANRPRCCNPQGKPENYGY